VTNSIKKGKDKERSFAHLLSAATSAKFVRVPNSGGLSTSGQTTDRRFKGDLYSDDPRFLDIVVESKCRKAPVTLNEMGNPKSELSGWIDQTIRESSPSFWILMFTWNRAPSYLICPPKDKAYYQNKDELHTLIGKAFDHIGTIIHNGDPVSLYRAKKEKDENGIQL
jgi:hypothetical protein